MNREPVWSSSHCRTGAHLISFEESKTISDLELQLQDLLEDPGLTSADQGIFEQVSHILRDARRSKAVTVRRRNIIMIDTVNSARRRSSTEPVRHKISRRMSS